MDVILDTTVLCSDFHLRGNAFRILLASQWRAGIRVIIPESVRDEAKNRFREECEEMARQFEKLERESKRVLLAQSARPAITHGHVEQLVLDYANELDDLFKNNGIRLLPYPQTAHRELVQRDLARKRPFREGRGYRDALVWAAVLEHLQSNPGPFAIVSGNSRDFSDGTGLHPDLKSDLLLMKFPQESAFLYRTLEDFNSARVTPTMAHLDDMKKRLQDGTAPLDLKAWASVGLKDLLADEEMFGPLDPEHSRLTLKSLDSIRSLRIDAVRQVGENQLLIAATAKTDGRLDISVTWEDFQNYRDVRELFGSDCEPFHFASLDWPVSLEAAFSLVVDSTSFRVLSAELDQYQGKNWTTMISPHPVDA